MRTACLLASVVIVVGCADLLPVRPRDGAVPDAPAADAAADRQDVGGGVRSGLVLHWRLDEPAGNEAGDSSGHGFTGLYTGEMGMPAPVADVAAPIMFADPLSRAFGLAERHSVQLAPLPALLKPEIDVTVAAWYRASLVDLNPATGQPSGSELVSGGNHYVLRLRPTQIEFSKRVMGTTSGAFVQCLGSADNHLDGNWHHLAGVSSAAGLKVYFDGVERCTSDAPNAVKPILYDQGPDFWVGRHGNTQTIYDFGGTLDEVRVYARVLTPEEIAALARGVE
jgi:hypothetical protein